MGGKKVKSKKARKVRSTPPAFAKEVRRIQRALSLDLLHRKYDIDKGDKGEVEGTQLDMACHGHCYVATEAAYHLFAKKKGFVPYTRRNDDETTHWWLRNRETSEILDPTKPQLQGEDYPYDKGHRQAFLTTQPSKRAKELIRRVKVVQKGKY